MSFWRQIFLTAFLGVAIILASFSFTESSRVALGLAEKVFFVGLLFLFLCFIRIWFRFVWFVTRTNESTLYNGMMGENIRTSRFARWLMHLDENGEDKDRRTSS